MKQFFKMFFASLLAMVIAGLLVVIVSVSLIVSLVSRATVSEPKSAPVATGTVLYIETDKQLHEQGENNSLAAFGEGSAFSSGVYDAVRAIEYAATDNNIKGIFLKLKDPANSWATLEQLRHALISFRKSGKFLYAYGESISQKAYYLGSAADSVFLNPVGSAELRGLSSTLTFFKGTLNMLHVEPEIFYAGRFKSATEPFRAEKMSDANRRQLSEIQQDIWREFVGAVAAHAGTDTASVLQWATSGAIQFPADALAHKLVDGLVYLDEVEQSIRAKTGQKEQEKIKYVKLDEYAQFVYGNRTVNDKRVAVLFAEGDIVDGSRNSDYQIASEDFIKTIRTIRSNDKIKAVVMRVNSPGGSALASEVILRELQLLQQKKPLIVSMGDVAASGGYYISCSADSIFAMPTTITGSIGVFTMLFNVEGLMKNKLGVTFDREKNAPYADFPSFSRPLTADESQRMQRQVDTIYALFKRRVAAGRHMEQGAVDSIAEGRIWSGTDALAIGLVDGTGNLDRALKSAAAKAGLDNYQVVTYPDRPDKLEMLMRRFSGNAVAEAMQAGLEQNLGEGYVWYRRIKDLGTLNGRAMMALPFTVDTY